MLKVLRGFEKFLYNIRDIFWDYPSIVLDENPTRDVVTKLYSSGIPYTHFLVATLSFTTLFIILFVTGIPSVLSKPNKTLYEAVVMGTNRDGEMQIINKVNPILPSNIQLEKDLVNMIYEPLIRYSYEEQKDGKQIGKVDYVLARDVITYKAGADYEFVLRQGVMWHDSAKNKSSKNYKELTVDDVIATFELMAEISDENGNAFTKAIKQLQWEKVDDYRIRICTIPVDAERGEKCDDKTDNPIFSNFFELIGFKVLPAHKLDDISTQNLNTSEPKLFRSPVGTGLFKVNDVNEKFIEMGLNTEHYSLKLTHSGGVPTRYLWDRIKEELTQAANEFNTLDSIRFSEYGNTVTVSFPAPVLMKDIGSTAIEDLPVKVDINSQGDRIENVRFMYFAYLQEAVDALKNGEVHSLVTNSTMYLDKLKEYTQLETHLSPVLYNQFWGLYFNLRTRPDDTSIAPAFLQEQKVRQAISLAIDKESILSNALSGVGVPAYSSIPSNSYYFNPLVFWKGDSPKHIRGLLTGKWEYDLDKGYNTNILNANSVLSSAGVKDSVTEDGWKQYNKERAVRLLEEAGWTIVGGDMYRTNEDGEILSFSLYFVENYDRRKVAEEIKRNLDEIGVQAVINRAEQSGQLENPDAINGWSLEELNNQILSPGLFDVILYGMQTFIDPDRYELYHSSQILYPRLNIAGYQSKEKTVEKNEDRGKDESSLIQVPKVDKYLELARSYDPDKDRSARKERYDVIQEIIVDEVPVVYLYHPQFIFFTNKAVQNVNMVGVDSIENRFVNIGEWQIK